MHHPSQPVAPQHLVERLIMEAIEHGELDNLLGEGRPIAGAGTVDDEYWWVREWLKRNQLKSRTKNLSR